MNQRSSDNAPVAELSLLPDEMRSKLLELKELSDRAESGDREARKELRRALKESGPQVIAQASDLARKPEELLISAVSAKNPLMEEALPLRLSEMRREIAGENPSPLELLLSEQIVACWLHVQFADRSLASMFHLGEGDRVPFSPGLHGWMLKWQEGVHRRYLAAVQSLARVRKLQSGAPSVQVNTQINVLGDRSLSS